MLNSAEMFSESKYENANYAKHEIFSANKYENANYAEYEFFSANKYENANYAEHDIFSANRYENANNSWHFHIYRQRNFYAQLCLARKNWQLLVIWDFVAGQISCSAELGTKPKGKAFQAS